MGSHDTIVAVIDSGIAESVSDLAPNLLIQECFLDEPSGAPCTSTYPTDDHGTGVASVAAAGFGGGAPGSGRPDAPIPRTFGGGPMVGVGPNLGLASYKVFETVAIPCSGDDCGARFLKAFLLSLQDAIDKHASGVPVDVVNMSIDLRIPRDSHGAFWAPVRAIVRMIDRANREGLVTVIAAGNDGRNDRRTRGLHSGVQLHPGVITVGGTGYQPDVLLEGNTPVFPTDAFVDTRVAYSNFGSGIDLVAPAGDVVCTSNARCTLAMYLYHGVVGTFLSLDPACIASRSCSALTAIDMGGTSRAAPHVAAAAALVIDRAKQQGMRLRPQQVKSILIRTAQPLGDRQLFGHGMVDVEAAILLVDDMARRRIDREGLRRRRRRGEQARR